MAVYAPMNGDVMGYEINTRKKPIDIKDRDDKYTSKVAARNFREVVRQQIIDLKSHKFA